MLQIWLGRQLHVDLCSGSQIQDQTLNVISRRKQRKLCLWCSDWSQGQRVQIDLQWSAFCKQIHVVADLLSKHPKEQETFLSRKTRDVARNTQQPSGISSGLEENPGLAAAVYTNTGISPTVNSHIIPFSLQQSRVHQNTPCFAECRGMTNLHPKGEW